MLLFFKMQFGFWRAAVSYCLRYTCFVMWTYNFCVVGEVSVASNGPEAAFLLCNSVDCVVDVRNLHVFHQHAYRLFDVSPAHCRKYAKLFIILYHSCCRGVDCREQQWGQFSVGPLRMLAGLGRKGRECIIVTSMQHFFCRWCLCWHYHTVPCHTIQATTAYIATNDAEASWPIEPACRNGSKGGGSVL